MNTNALTSAALAGLIRPQVADVNMVSAPVMVKERGIILSEARRDKSGVFDGYIKLTVKTANQTRSIAGTCFSDGKPRFIQIKGINLDAEVGTNMVYTTNRDAPGIIGLLGTVFGKAGVNIANFQLGRNRPGGDAIALLYVDEPVAEEVLDLVRSHAGDPVGQAAGVRGRVDAPLKSRGDCQRRRAAPASGPLWAPGLCSARAMPPRTRASATRW